MVVLTLYSPLLAAYDLDEPTFFRSHPQYLYNYIIVVVIYLIKFVWNLIL